METSQSVHELVAAAQTDAALAEARISDVLTLMGGSDGSDAQQQELCAATVALELAAVDVFSAFEARMQHHFKRGPFSRKLKALLLESGQADLADRVHQHYLAINVLKHGTGASYRELRDMTGGLFVVKPASDVIADEAQPQPGLVDVTVAGFFAGLTKVILEAYEFLESQ